MKNSIYFTKPMTLCMISIVLGNSTLQAQNITVTIDKTKQYQTIDGFGTQYGNRVYWDFTLPHYTEDHLKRMIDDLQISLHRTWIDPKLEMENDNNDANVADLAKYRANLSKLSSDQCKGEYIAHKDQIAYMKAYNERALKNGDTIKFYGSVISPPHWMKYTSCTFGTDPIWNRLVTSEEEKSKGGTAEAVKDRKDEFAEWLYATTKIWQEQGVDFYAVGIQNEPAFAQGYGSCVYSSEAMAGTIRAVGRRMEKENMKTKILFPEDMGDVVRTNSYVIEASRDAEVLKFGEIFGVHQYNQDGVTPGSIAASTWASLNRIANRSRKRKFWMTETSGFGTGLQGFSKMYSQIFAALKFGKVTGWTWLEAADNNSSEENHTSFFVNKNGSQAWAKKGLAFKHYCKFIRPNSVMVDAISSDDANISSLAFQDNYRKRMTIILINNDTVNSKTVTLSFPAADRSAYPATLNGYKTSESDDFVKINDFNANAPIILPPRSIFTLLGTSAPMVLTGNEEEQIEQSKLVIFPNPSNSETVTIQIPNAASKEAVEIMNSQLNTIDIQHLSIANNEAQLNVNNLTNGLYFVKVGNKISKLTIAK